MEVLSDQLFKDLPVRFAGIDKVFEVTNYIDLDFTTIRWYGAIIAFGFTLAVLFGGRTAYVWKINLDKMIDVLLYGTVAAIVGARLYYVAFEWDMYKDNLLSIFEIWKGGLAIYGGIIGGILAAFVVCKVEKLNFYNLLDMCNHTKSFQLILCRILLMRILLRYKKNLFILLLRHRCCRN